MKSVLDKVVKITNERVRFYGAPYAIFATFGLFNYPLSSLYYLLIVDESENLLLRGICTILCIVLLFYKKLGHNFQKYVPLYWYLTVCFSVPFFATYMTMANQVSLSWLMNDILGLFLLILIIDWWMFCVVLVVGVVSGITTYLILGGQIVILAANTEIKMALYMSLFAVVLGGGFSRNKELLHRSRIARTEAEKFFLETEVAKRTENLKKALAANRKFLASISHEVRTPLQGVIGMSKELSDKWKKLSDEKKYFYIKLIASNSDRLRILMNSILELTKFSMDKMRLNYEDNVDIVKIVEEVKQVGETLIISEKKKLLISVKVKEGINRSLYCDGMRITQVMTNLVSNAIKYTASGEITVYVDNTNDGVLVSVQDQGDGIPQGEEEQIFEAFVQSSANMTKGKGLGLALCQEIIQSHGGQIWMQNVKKRGKVVGSRFSFAVPYGKDVKSSGDVSEQKTLAEDALIKNTEKDYELPIKRLSKKPLKIAVVDDEFVCLEAVKLYLHNSGYEIFTFEGGKEVLDYLRQGNTIDLLLLDIMMPHVDGFKVVEELSKDKLLSNIPVVLQSGLSDIEQIRLLYSREARVIGRILKPYNKHVLVDVIKQIYG